MTDATKLLKTEHRAADSVRKVASEAPEGAFHGFVPAETMEWLYTMLGLLAAELVKPHLSFDVPRITLGVDKHNRRQLGHYKIGRDALGLRWRIDMNILHLGRTKADVIRVLLHETLHAVQHESGTPAKIANYHNAQFREWCERLGIPTDSSGHDLGTVADGLYDQFAKRHKLDGTAKLLAPKSLPKPGGSKLKKWSCTGCDEPVNVRVATPDFDATCNLCGTVFVYTDKR